MCINLSKDGGFIVTGRTHITNFGYSSRSFIFKTDSLGNVSCLQFHPQMDVSTLSISDTPFNTTILSGWYLVNRTFNVTSGINYKSLCGSLSTDELVSNKSIIYYPNPTSGILTFDAEKFNSDPTIKIYNLLGEKVFNGLLKKGTKNVIDLSSLNPGIYAAEIYCGKEHFTSKIIVE